VNNIQSDFYVCECELGRGLFASRDFAMGDVLFIFTGPEIDLATTIAKGDAEANALQIGPLSYIDLEVPSVYANHSCAPNTGIKNKTEAIALRAIKKDEEIRYDYSTTMSENRWTMQCGCLALSCRRVVRDFHELPHNLQLYYLDLGVVQNFIVEEFKKKTEPNQALQRTITAVTERAPSSTLRASHDRLWGQKKGSWVDS